MIRRWFGPAGVLLIVVGAVLIVGPTFGFAALTGDRSAQFNVAADQQNAYLGVQSEDDVGTLRGDDDPRVVGNLTNNFQEDVDVIEMAITNDSGVLAVDSPSSGTTIATGSTQNVSIACAESTNLGERNIGVEVVEASGATVSVEGVSFNVTVDIQCNKGSGSGLVNFQADDVNTTDTSQTFSFDADGLGNRDEAYIDLSDPQGDGVDYTNGTVEVVSGAGSATYDASADRITYTASGNEQGTIELRIDGIDVVGAAGERYKVTYTESRKNANNRDDSDIFYITD